MQGKNLTPVPKDQHRPFWTVIIPCHNSAHWLKQSLSCVLSQAPTADNMQIIVVDDHSDKDDPQSVVKALGDGRVEFVSQATNVGKSLNFRTGLNHSRGKWIHILHADDYVDSDFYVSMEAAIHRLPHVGAVFCESRYVNEQGIVTGRTGKEATEVQQLSGWPEKMYTAQRIQTPSIVVRRDVYETIGTFRTDLRMTEDWEMWIRISLSFPFAFCPDTFANYRVSSANSSARAIENGLWHEDLRRLASVTDSLAAAFLTKKLRAERNLGVALFLSRFISHAVHTGKFRAAIHCAGWSLWWSRDWRVVKSVVRNILQNKKINE